jgi:hypothetical protein
LKRFGIGLLCGVAGYIAVALASYLLIEQFSSNQHDRELEAAMTSIFFFGPMGAVLAFVVGIVGSRRSPPTER